MAAYPCTIGNHRYAGAQRSAYISLVAGRDPTTVKFRLCQRHLDDLRLVCAEQMQPLSEDQYMSSICEWTDCTEDRKATMFVKLYLENHDEPEEYAVDVCAQHADELSALLLMTDGMPMERR